jgi:hypothetical protein
MSRRNISVLAISITLMLLVTLAMPAIAVEPKKGEETAPASTAKVYTGATAGTQKVYTQPQFASVSYGPITQSYGGSVYYYVSYGGALSGVPVVVTGLAIPYTSPYYASQQVNTNTFSNYGTNQYQYVRVTSHDGKNLTGSYIKLIGIY